MPGPIKNWNKKLIMLKAETTEGTDAAPGVAADVIKVRNFTPTFMNADQKVRTLEKAFFGADPVALASFRRGASFDMDWHGAGTATGIPPWMKVLAFCGFGTPVVGASSVTLSPVTDSIAAATFYTYIDDLLLKAIGTRGGVGFTFQDDEIPIFSINMLGRPPLALAEQATPPALVPTGYIDPLIASTEVSTFTYGGYAFPLRSWTMSDNAQLALRSLINPQDRINYGGRSWSGTVVVRVPDITVANANPFATIRTGATLPATAVHGTTAGNIVQADCPRLQITGDVALSNEDGETMATIPVTALPNVGNDEVIFTTK